MNPTDVFAGSRLFMASVPLIVEQEQLSISVFYFFSGDKETSSTQRLIGLCRLSTSHPDQLVLELFTYHPEGAMV